MGRVVTKTLYIIDNSADLPLQDDTAWLPGLLQARQPGDKLLLVSFADDALITLRRQLVPPFAETEILALTQHTLGHLAAVEAQLPALAIEGLICGLDIQRCHYHRHGTPPGAAQNHGEQASRQGYFAPGQLEALARESLAVAKDLSPADARPPADALPTAERPRLAFVSPLPPEATGIADYSAELLPYLAAHYDITLVVSQPTLDEALTARFPVLQADAFRAASDTFDRVLYQLGNSPYHAFQFELLRDHPGTVVLHDIYLFDAVWWLADSGLWPDGLRRRLFQDHGYPAVLALDAPAAQAGPAGAANREIASASRGPEEYPVNGFVTAEAAGLIYHSAFAAALDRHWRLDAWREAPAIIPHLRKLPPAQTPEHKLHVRKRLEIHPDACLIASFGGINPKKMTDCVIDAFLEGDWGQAENVYLVLVGAQHSGDYGKRLERRLRQHPRGKRVRVTGYVERQEYLAWLQAADIAVQLRQSSRGESSGAILDAMAHGLAVVANAHGSSTELPGDAVTMLPSGVTTTQLSSALEALINTPQRCQQQGQQARHWVATQLDPPTIADAYREAIEHFAHHARRHHREAWLDQLARLSGVATCTPQQLASVTRSLGDIDTLTPQGPPRLLFDVSTIAWHDLKTGIERVTRRLADELLRHPPSGWRVELIRWGGEEFHLARGFASAQLGIQPPGPDRPYQPQPGDVYLSVEWAPPLLQQAGAELKRLRAQGVRCYFTVHDLLPLHLPDCFPPEVPATMRRWFSSIAQLADGITCVSATVAEDVRRELERMAQPQPPWVAHFHLGADFHRQPQQAADQQHQSGLKRAEQRLLATIQAQSGATLLMVGTLEPRKGHQQVLDALELCWQRQLPLNLVIVGKQGWQVEALAKRLRQHTQSGQRLFWLDRAGDALLAQLYRHCDALVAASLGEGFGLPLIEAAQHGIAIIARDIAVFREVAGEHADYFQGSTAEALADELSAWHQRWQQGQHRHSHGLPFHRWEQAAEQWLAPILADLPASPSPALPGELSC